MKLAYAMIAGGLFLAIGAAMPLGYSAWLSREAQFVSGWWLVSVGIGVVILLDAMKEDRT